MVLSLAALFEAERINVTLGGRRILHDVSFEVAPATWFGLLGVNGSGKTTLLRALAGRLRPDSGKITLSGSDLSKDEGARAKRVGFAPPPDSLPADLSGGELIDLIGAARKAPARQPAELYEALGVGALERVMIGQMSSGMRQRIAVFSAFVGAPELVLLDEPFNWLDPIAAYDLKGALEARTKAGDVIITALHEIATFALRCNTGLLLHEGQVIHGFGAAGMARGRADIAAFEHEVYGHFRAEA